MSVEYSAVAAKLKAMYARFLDKKDYEELLSKRSVGDVCAYLKSMSGYSDVLSDVDEREIHRGVMELILENNVMDEYIRIYKFVDKEKRSLLSFWFMQREVEFLKREIRYIYNNEKRSSDEVNQGRFDAFFETHTKIDKSIMQSASSLDDCIRACADTPYAMPLGRAASIGADFFSMGAVLDSFLYSRVWREAHKKLKNGQLKLFEELIGSKIDMLNLMWIYRGKKYYGFPSEIIFTYLLPVRHRVSEESLRAAVHAPDAEKAVEIVVGQTPYGELFDGISSGSFPEENYRTMYARTARKIFVNHTESLAAIFAYLVLKQFETDNITTVTEGVRYGLNPGAISGHVRF